MNNREAIRAMLDGEKVRNPCWGNETHHIYYNGEHFVNEYLQTIDVNVYMELTNHWEVYKKYVSFFEAYNAMEHGKRIKHKRWGSACSMVNWKSGVVNKQNYIEVDDLASNDWEICD